MIVDTGPLVAWLNGRDRWHSWAKATLGGVTPPLLTCQAVVAETCFLLRNVDRGSDAVLALCERGALRVAFDLDAEIRPVRALLAKYADVPMSLADGCLVRMSEIEEGLPIATLDSDFRVYRRHRRRIVPVRMPEELG